ncbi:MAG: hypothetical protein CMF80_01255 [Candidatus Marinimicrobia bacterium]|nr:hypothetical protein [Candidatus Neomarinimicrobiota bacterium]
MVYLILLILSFLFCQNISINEIYPFDQYRQKMRPSYFHEYKMGNFDGYESFTYFTSNSCDKPDSLVVNHYGSPTYRIYYTYDLNDNIIQIYFDWVFGTPQDSDTLYEFLYDDNNNLITKKIFNTSPFIYYNFINYYYDTNNNLIHEVNGNSSVDYIFNEVFYSYDINNNLIQKSEIDGNGNIESETFYIYNDQNLLVQENEWYDEGYWLYEKNYTYDDSNLIEEITYFNSLGWISIDSSIEYYYNENNLIQEVHKTFLFGTDSYSISKIIDYSYDYNHNLIEINNQECSSWYEDYIDCYQQYLTTGFIYDECIECSEVNGNMNEDSNLDILDIVMVVTCIISENCDECSDTNDDGSTDVTDIILLVNIILE